MLGSCHHQNQSTTEQNNNAITARNSAFSVSNSLMPKQILMQMYTPKNNLFCVQCSLVSVLTSVSSYIALLSPTCKPWAVDLSPIIRRCVSQGERSPTSTCLQCNRSGTGLTLQLGSFRIWAVSFRKPGNSPVRSNWTFRRTRNFKTLQKSKDIFWWSPKNKQANIVA